MTPRASDDRDDLALAAAAAAGERGALEALLERHVDRVHSICARIVRDPADAQDASQEALLAVARRIDRFDGRSAFTTWLYRVATNAALDEVRRRGRRPRPSEVLDDALTFRPADEPATAAVDVHAALDRLPEKFRVPVVLRDVDGLDYAEITDILGIPPGTVRSRIARGRALLASLLGNHQTPAERPSK